MRLAQWPPAHRDSRARAPWRGLPARPQPQGVRPDRLRGGGARAQVQPRHRGAAAPQRQQQLQQRRDELLRRRAAALPRRCRAAHGHLRRNGRVPGARTRLAGPLGARSDAVRRVRPSVCRVAVRAWRDVHGGARQCRVEPNGARARVWAWACVKAAVLPMGALPPPPVPPPLLPRPSHCRHRVILTLTTAN